MPVSAKSRRSSIVQSYADGTGPQRYTDKSQRPHAKRFSARSLVMCACRSDSRSGRLYALAQRAFRTTTCGRCLGCANASASVLCKRRDRSARKERGGRYEPRRDPGQRRGRLHVDGKHHRGVPETGSSAKLRRGRGPRRGCGKHRHRTARAGVNHSAPLHDVVGVLPRRIAIRSINSRPLLITSPRLRSAGCHSAWS